MPLPPKDGSPLRVSRWKSAILSRRSFIDDTFASPELHSRSPAVGRHDRSQRRRQRERSGSSTDGRGSEPLVLPRWYGLGWACSRRIDTP